jgi:hypothetical protein
MLVPHQWPGARHCENCNKPVFFATTKRDAAALGRVGHCIQLEAPEPGSSLFIGLIRSRPATKPLSELNIAILLSSNNLDEMELERAIAGFAMYFQHLPEFARLELELRNSHQVRLACIPAVELFVWQTRLAEWGLSTTIASEA